MTTPKWRRGRAPRIVLPAPEGDYSRENEAQTRRQIEMFLSRFGEARAGDASAGGAASTRRTTQLTIEDATAGESYEGTIDLGGTALLYDATANYPGIRFRLYEREAFRTLDAARPETDAPDYPCALDVSFAETQTAGYPDQETVLLDAGLTIRLRGTSGNGEPLLVTQREHVSGEASDGLFYWTLDIDVGTDLSDIPLTGLGPFIYEDDMTPPSNWTPLSGDLGIGIGNLFMARGGTTPATPYTADYVTSPVIAGDIVAVRIDGYRYAADGMSDMAAVCVGVTGVLEQGALSCVVRRVNSSNVRGEILYHPRSGGPADVVTLAVTGNVAAATDALLPTFDFYADSTTSTISANTVLEVTGDPIPAEFYQTFAGTRIIGLLSKRSLVSSAVGLSTAGWYIGPPGDTPRVTLDLTYLPLENFNA